MEHTLVLDVSWQPVAKVEWTRAITLLWEKKVEVIAPYEGKILHSASWDIPMPAVIRFLRMGRHKKRGIKFSRESLLLRDRFTCQYCGKTVTRKEATYDHVTPRVDGGPTRWENILISCVACNQKKGGRTPQQAGMKALSVPVRPKTLPEHLHVDFEWRDSYPQEWKAFLRDAVATHQYWNSELEET